MILFVELLGLFVLLLLPFLYKSNHIFRYYCKFILYYVIIIFVTLVLIPVFIFRPFDVRNAVWISIPCRMISKIIGLKFDIRGREILEKEQAYIIVANHQSSLDLLALFELSLKKCTVVAKKELFYVWPFGLSAWLVGLVFIDRMRSENARRILHEVGQRLKDNNIKLWFYPEGTRRNTGEIHSFKSGAFHLAVEEQLPIVPIVHSSYCGFLNDKKKILNPGHIIISALPPISTEGLTKADIPDLIEKVHKQMSETYKQTSAEIISTYRSNKDLKNPLLSDGDTKFEAVDQTN